MSATPSSMLQVISSGLQDYERLNTPVGSPSVHFYKSVMRRRTRWASQWRRVEFDNLADFGKTAVVTLPILGELITRATLVVQFPDIYTPQIEARTANPAIVGPSWAWTNSLGHAICSDVQMLIGDQIIDQFDSRSLEVLDELTTPIEHYDSTNQLISRDPSAFSDQELLQVNQGKASSQSPNQTVEIVFPFWWNRGPGPQALPIQALYKDKVQIKVTFRPVQQCVYTSTRLDPRNPPLSPSQGAAVMPNIAGCGFFATDPSGTPIYNAAASPQLPSNPFLGSVTAEAMPSNYHFLDAYWIVEYVSLEDREAAAYRLADLEIPIEQHVALPIVETGGAEHVRIRLDKGGLVRDLSWVAQRVEAESYNAYFLFSKDLGPKPTPPPLVDSNGNPLEPTPVQNPCDIPWWPNANVQDWDYGNGYIRPAFADRNSDPVLAAKMLIRGLTRFDHESPSMFRSVIPLHNCKRIPLVNRYIYRYEFGFWSTGGLAETNDLPVDEIRGYSNWDKLPKRELALVMNLASYWDQQWTLADVSGIVFKEGSIPTSTQINVPQTTDGLLIILTGAHPTEKDVQTIFNGNGAIVAGILDYRKLLLQPDYLGLYARVIKNGSASIVIRKPNQQYTWLAVAGGGGKGNSNAIRYLSNFPSLVGVKFGGSAGSAIDIGWQGGNNAQTHAKTSYTDKYINYTNSNTDEFGVIQDPLATITYAIGSTVSSKTFIMLFNTSIDSFQFVMNNIDTPVQVELHSDNTLLDDISGNPCSYIVPLQPSLATKVTYTFTTEVNPPANTIYNVYIPITKVKLYIGEKLNIRITAVTIASIFSYQVAKHEGTLSCNIFTSYLLTNNVDENAPVWFGGGGGGTLATNESSGVGLTDGRKMTTDAAFVQSTVVSYQFTGGQGEAGYGGDGYYGGGSGFYGGGGGGSYVDPLLTCVNTFEHTKLEQASAKIFIVNRVPPSPPKFVIYSWITRYNRLRINSGRGVIMFNEAT